MTSAELDRLAGAAPAQARQLLETEGYFKAEVTIARSEGGDGLPLLTLRVVPGPRVTVARVAIDAAEPLAPRTPTPEEPWTDRLAHLRSTWSLRPGQPFRQPAWSAAKVTSLAALARRRLRDRDVAVDARAHRCHRRRPPTSISSSPAGRSFASAGSGSRGSAASTRLRCAGSRRSLRAPSTASGSCSTTRSGCSRPACSRAHRSSSTATGPPDAVPVIVKVKELSEQQATFGIGYSANTGPRISVEHYDRKFFGQPWISHSTLTLGPDQKLLGVEFTSYPLENMWHNLLAANVEQLRAADETRNSCDGARRPIVRHESAGAALRTLESTQPRVDNAALSDVGAATSAQLPLAASRPRQHPGADPRDGAFAAGRCRLRAKVARSAPTCPTSKRARVRSQSPTRASSGTGRSAPGTRTRAPRPARCSSTTGSRVPDTVLFRAGGDNSVRGYGYRTLGPTVNGAVVGGRVLATGSVEVEHPLTARLPALLGALFVDAGNAADRWDDLTPGARLRRRTALSEPRRPAARRSRLRRSTCIAIGCT